MTLRTLHAGRGIAALAVVASHASTAAQHFSQTDGGAWAKIAAQGRHGVDFFFVLSGFLMAYKYYGVSWSSSDARKFAASRLKRIYLPYLPVGIAVAMIYTALPNLSQGTHIWHWLPSLTLLPMDQNPALSVAWTLQHEIFFYFLFGALILAKRLKTGLLIWGVAIVAGTIMDLPKTTFALINLEFIAGAALGISAQSWSRFAALEAKMARRIPSQILAIGTMSYSLYLIHNPVISVVARMSEGGAWLDIWATSITASLVAGAVYYRWIEKPAMRHLELIHARAELVRPGNAQRA